MTPEEAYNSTLEKTDEVLEYYSRHLKKKLKEIYGENYSLEYVKTPKYYDYDATFYLNGERKLNVEVKVRDDITLNQYSQTKLPFRKHAVSLAYFTYREIKTVYLVLFSDCVAVLNLHEKPDNVKDMVARWDRGNDSAEYAMYDVTRFTQIG